MKFKKVMSILSLILVLNSTNVLATNSISDEHIPKYMDPGTTITFDENNNVVTLKKGEETEFSKEYSPDIDESTLPLAKEGMIVTYDALGQPVVINQDARKQSEIKIDVKKVETDTQISDSVTPMATENTQTGKTTFYYASGGVGQSGATLDEWSAAHMFIPFWKKVNLYDTTNTSKATSVWVLDRGNLQSPVIIDIDYKRFTTDFYSSSVGWFDSRIVWYTN